MRTLILGETLVDLICERPAASLAEASGFAPHVGGAAANAAVACARAGGRVVLASGAGDDEWGRWLRTALHREGVGLEAFTLVPGAPTAVAFVTVALGGEPSFAIYGEGIETAMASLEDRVEELVGTCDALVVGSNTLVGETAAAVTARAVAAAREAGRPLVVDPNLRVERWETPSRAADAIRPFCRGAFLVKCNAAEGRLLTGEDDPVAAAEGLLAAGAEHVVVTLGADGAILRGGGLRADAPGVPASPVNTTGAGDALLGTLLARLDATGYYAPALAAGLAEAVEAAARATERWGAI